MVRDLQFVPRIGEVPHLTSSSCATAPHHHERRSSTAAPAHQKLLVKMSIGDCLALLLVNDGEGHHVCLDGFPWKGPLPTLHPPEK